MLQQAIALLLQRLLGKFITFNPNMLRLSIWQGDVSFRDVELKLAYGQGSIGELSLRIPWRALWTQAVIIKAKRVRIFIHTNNTECQSGNDGAFDCDEATAGHAESAEFVKPDIEPSDDRTYLSRLVTHIVSNVQMDITDVETRYECTKSSSSQVFGVAVATLQQFTLYNADIAWKMIYNSHSTPSLESRKRLRFEDAAVYVKYSDGFERDNVERKDRIYLAHNWCLDVKALLCYSAPNAEFCDVDLCVSVDRLDVSSAQHEDVPDRRLNTESCKLCRHAMTSDEILARMQPQIHVSDDHIDIFYSILMEIKTPYEEYDRLTDLRYEGNISRSQGFQMVLVYAKQWILSDCLEAEKTELLVAQSGDGNDNDDELEDFEDAVSPPTLSVQLDLKHGLSLQLFSRGYSDIAVPDGQKFYWNLIAGISQLSLKQSCIEDEIKLSVSSLKITEKASLSPTNVLYDALDLGSQDHLLQFSCMIPALESRIVGHQTAVNLKISQSSMLVLSDQILTSWLLLFSPMYRWWKMWDQSHPRKVLRNERKFSQAEFCDLSVKCEAIHIILIMHSKFAFGISLDRIFVLTKTKEEMTCTLQIEKPCCYTTNSIAFREENIGFVNRLRELDENRYLICGLADIRLVKSIEIVQSVHTKSEACVVDNLSDEHLCAYTLDIPSTRISLRNETLEHVAWLFGKWSFIFINSQADNHQIDAYIPTEDSTLSSRSSYKISILEIDMSCDFSSDRFVNRCIQMTVKNLGYVCSHCAGASEQQMRISSLILNFNTKMIIDLRPSGARSSLMLDVKNRIGAVFASENEHESSYLYTKRISQGHLCLGSLFMKLNLTDLHAISKIIANVKKYHTAALLILSSYGYTLEEFRKNLTHLQPIVKDNRAIIDEYQFDFDCAGESEINLMHPCKFKTEVDDVCQFMQIGAIKWGQSKAHYVYNSSISVCTVKGSITNLGLYDFSQPKVQATGEEMLYRQCIGANSIVEKKDESSWNHSSVLDFHISRKIQKNSVQLAVTTVQIRLDSVRLVYLHRVYKQFQHYITDHWMPFLKEENCPFFSAAFMNEVYKKFELNRDQIPVSVDVLLQMYASYMEKTHTTPPDRSYTTHIEVVAHDLTFSLPRNSFAPQYLALHCTSARFWSADIDLENSEFLRTGELDQVRHSDLNIRSSEIRRAWRSDAREIKRQAQNLRSQILNARSQAYVDLKAITQKANNRAHEGYDIDSELEQCLKTLHSKVLYLDQQLQQIYACVDGLELLLQTHIPKSPSRNSLTESQSSKFDPSEIEDKIAAIRQDLDGITQQFSEAVSSEQDSTQPENQTANLDQNRKPLFKFDLVDLNGGSFESSVPLFRHSLATGCIAYEIESIPTENVYHLIELCWNELSVGVSINQYTTLLGILFENFREVGSIINEDTYALCALCNGHHYATQSCYSVWLKVAVRIMDVGLRIAKLERPISDILMEQFLLSFTVKTDDSLEIQASASSMSVLDVRPTKLPLSKIEVLSTMGGDENQISFIQKTTWTECFRTLELHRAHLTFLAEAVAEIAYFFAYPIIFEVDHFMKPLHGFLPVPVSTINTSHFELVTKNCFFALLESFVEAHARAVVILFSSDLSYVSYNHCSDLPDMTKCHIHCQQRGIYISHLSESQIDVSFSLTNPFSLVLDYIIERSRTDEDAFSRRNSFVLEPIETRLSVQDLYLLINILENYTRALGSFWCIVADEVEGDHTGNDEHVDTQSTRALSTMSSLTSTTLQHTVTCMSSTYDLQLDTVPDTLYTADKLLGDIGEIRIVLVNNSLGIPVADVHMTDVVCEYLQSEDCSTVFGARLSFNYFNNSIYRWEPLVEPFSFQVRIIRSFHCDSHLDVTADIPNPINLNVTPAMAPLITSEVLKQADFVTTGSKSTAPFWIENHTGLELQLSFRRGRGLVIQSNLKHAMKIPIDCRDHNDITSFDQASSDRFLSQIDSSILIVNHTLSVYFEEKNWTSAYPVVVDVVGHVSILLEDAERKRRSSADANRKENIAVYPPPVLVAEISIQSDGSKLIHLHSQIVIQNQTCVPLLIWAFTPRSGGNIGEWIIDREQVCHVPLHMIHPQSKISLRPSQDVEYAPLVTTLEELCDPHRVVKMFNTKRFIRSGNCVCNFITYAEEPEPVPHEGNVQPMPGYIVRDFPRWQCTYDVEAYYLMRAAAPQYKDTQLSTARTCDDEQVLTGQLQEEDFSYYSFNHQQSLQMRSAHLPLEADVVEDMSLYQHRGVLEATNASLYHLCIAPFLSLHNRLATAIAYRFLNQSLQLIAEGVLAIGSILPLFQVDHMSPLYISFRLENYHWSSPQPIMNPKVSSLLLPYKESVIAVELRGRSFDRQVTSEQDTVPDLQIQLKLSNRDVYVYCSVWIVNHSDLDMEYCQCIALSSKRMESMTRYLHAKCSLLQEETHFSRSTPSYAEIDRDVPLMRLEKKFSAVHPVALHVVIKEARNLYKSQAWGLQSPYVRVSLYALRQEKRKKECTSLQCIDSGETRPSSSGDIHPKWDHRHHNMLLLQIPPDVKSMENALILMDIRNVKYGMDSSLGVAVVRLEEVLKDRARAADFHWYKVKKRAANTEANSHNKNGLHHGDVLVSITVGTSQQLSYTQEVFGYCKELEEGGPGFTDSPSIYEDSFQTILSPKHPPQCLQLSQTMESDSAKYVLPTLTGTLPLHRLQAPMTDASLYHLPSTTAGGSFLDDYALPSTLYKNVTSRHAENTLLSARARGPEAIHPSPRYIGGSRRFLQVYLPQNRFLYIIIQANTLWSMTDVFDAVCERSGVYGAVDAEDYDFYELVLPRFVSLRSAGRPEGERWYGPRICMDARLDQFGALHGLHLCHKITIATIRIYDESSTASAHHVTPRALLTHAKQHHPAQHRATPWGEVLLYGSSGKNWDVLRIKTSSSSWSEAIRLKQNAIGNSGSPQVITLTNEVYEHEDIQELRKGHQELAVWTCYGSGRFADTIVATIVPRYILINRTFETIQYRQLQVPHTFQLEPNAIKSFHWPSASKPKLLQVTLLQRYTWSGSFRIRSLGTTYLKLRDCHERARIYILQCQIENIGGSTALIFREESKRFPPYRIDNMTSFRIQYRQTDWGTKKDYDELLPRSSCAYSWDQLDGGEKASMAESVEDATASGSTFASLNHALRIRFMRVTSSTTGEDSAKDVIEVKEYYLDEMVTHRRIQLQRSLPSQLFTSPVYHGYLYRKDTMTKWTKKYFRLYDHMLYYFSTRTDQELLGVIDLWGSQIPGSSGVRIVENADENTTTQKANGNLTLNGIVASISDTIFGTTLTRKSEVSSQERSVVVSESADYRTYAALLMRLLQSSEVQTASRAYAQRRAPAGSSNAIFVHGQTLLHYLEQGNAMERQKAIAISNAMLKLGMLQRVGSSTTIDSQRIVDAAWYHVRLEQNGESGSVTETALCLRDRTNTVHSTRFSIVTSNNLYELKAPSLEIARRWILHLHRSINHDDDDVEKSLEEKDGTLSRSGAVSNAAPSVKTFVHVRIRADGPTKVLELIEGGEEDFDERDSRHELKAADSLRSNHSGTEIVAGGNSLFLQIKTEGIGISCVNETPMELVYVFFGGVSIHYAQIANRMRLKITLNEFVADNQSNEATFPKLLCPRKGQEASSRDCDEHELEVRTVLSSPYVPDISTTNDMDGESIFVCADCNYRQPEIAAMHFCCTWSNEQGTTAYFEHCSFWLYPVIVQLDEDLLISLRSFCNTISEPWAHKDHTIRKGEIRLKSVPMDTMMESLSELTETIHSEELDPLKSLSHFSATPSGEMQKVYFALLHIHPIEFDITYRSDMFQATTSILVRDSSHVRHNGFANAKEHLSSEASVMNSSTGERLNGLSNKFSAQWVLPNLSMHVPDLDNAPVRLNALMIEHAFGTGGELVRRVSKYYTRQLWKQLHKILGSFDFLGNPIGFLDHIGTGVRDFVYEPIEGLKVGGKGFRRGLAKGTASLVTNTLDGTFDAASKISGTFGQGLATMSLDEYYQQTRARARRIHVRGIREGLVQGSKELSLGVYEGVAGLILGPIRGTKENGGMGFVKGAITGIIGLPTKPVAGIFDFASRATQGVRNRSYNKHNTMQRVRKPRVFGRYNELRCYKEVDVIAHELLRRTGGENLTDEKILFYFEVIQRVTTSEFVNEARQKLPNEAKSSHRKLQEMKKQEGAQKLIYDVTFFDKRLGLELESDFYCENVTIKSFDSSAGNYKVETKLEHGQKVLQNGDCLLGVCGVDVRGIGFHETLRLLRGSARPVTVQFRSYDEHVSSAPKKRLMFEATESTREIDLTHWVIVTEERALYIELGIDADPVVKWATPLSYIYRVEHVKGVKVSLHLRVGVDSLPTGPRSYPSWKSFETQKRHMQVFKDTMRASFGPMSTIADEQELWPSDTSLNGFLIKKGGFTSTKRWFVLSRNCLYYFTTSKELKGIIPLGNVRFITEQNDPLCIKITSTERERGILTLSIDSGQVIQRMQNEITLIAVNIQELEVWQSSLAHAAGRGLRHSRGKRFFVSTKATRLDIGCRETPDFVATSLENALKKTVQVYAERNAAYGAT